MYIVLRPNNFLLFIILSQESEIETQINKILIEYQWSMNGTNNFFNKYQHTQMSNKTSCIRNYIIKKSSDGSHLVWGLEMCIFSDQHFGIEEEASFRRLNYFLCDPNNFFNSSISSVKCEEMLNFNFLYFII